MNTKIPQSPKPTPSSLDATIASAVKECETLAERLVKKITAFMKAVLIGDEEMAADIRADVHEMIDNYLSIGANAMRKVSPLANKKPDDG